MLRDLLFKRYGGAVQEVLLLEYEDFIAQINYVMEEINEEDVRNRWVNGYQSISLDEFKQAVNYKRLSEIKYENKSVEDILTNLFETFG